MLQAFCPPPFRMRTRKGTSIRCLRPQSCPVPLDQKYGGHQGPDIRSCSPRGFVMRQAGPHRTHSTDLILWTWTLPQVPKCSRPSAACLISHRTGTRRYGGVVLTFPIASLTQRISLERERSVTTVTSVP